MTWFFFIGVGFIVVVVFISSLDPFAWMLLKCVCVMAWMLLKSVAKIQQFSDMCKFTMHLLHIFEDGSKRGDLARKWMKK